MIQLRKVPANWQHPKEAIGGKYIPLSNLKFSEHLAIQQEAETQWNNGFRDNWSGGWQPREGGEIEMSFEEWGGERLKPKNYFVAGGIKIPKEELMRRFLADVNS